MSCDSENWQAKSAYSDIIDTIKLISIEMDCLEIELDETELLLPKNKNKEQRAIIRELKERIDRMNEVYDRLCDLSEMVNVPENEPVEDDECNDDDCDCHQ